MRRISQSLFLSLTSCWPADPCVSSWNLDLQLSQLIYVATVMQNVVILTGKKKYIYLRYMGEKVFAGSKSKNVMFSCSLRSDVVDSAAIYVGMTLTGNSATTAK